MSDRPEFFTPWWQERMAALSSRLVDGVTDDFLDWPEVAACGLTTEDENAVEFEVEHWGTYPVPPGHPHPLTARHHGAIISRCLSSVDTVAPTVVEFGGGFGSMAHIASTLADVSWVVIDSAPMRTLQNAYLMRRGCAVATAAHPGSAYLASHAFVAHCLAGDQVDVFIGTWSVSEATEACHDWLIDHGWFGAETVFLAVDISKPDDFGDGCGLVKRLEMIHAFDVVPSPFPGSVYVTRGIEW